MPGNPQPLYGSIPYVTGFSSEAAASILWVNSAQTTVDIDDSALAGDDGSLITFSSESGALEFFVFSSALPKEVSHTNRVKKINRDLATISGFAPMPMIQTLGFHFCKWANVSAEILMDRNRDFTEYGFPLDVVWSDIEWAQQNSSEGGYEYFRFNEQNFTDESIAMMNEQIEEQGRRITLIIDPHVKAVEDYFVYAEGIKYQYQE